MKGSEAGGSRVCLRSSQEAPGAVTEGVRERVVREDTCLVGRSGKSLHVMSRLTDFVTTFHRGSNPVGVGDQGKFL